MSLAPGARLGPYEIVSPLGAGGMGEVYRARHVTLQREAAIKVLPSELSTDPELLRRFRAEVINHHRPRPRPRARPHRSAQVVADKCAVFDLAEHIDHHHVVRLKRIDHPRILTADAARCSAHLFHQIVQIRAVRHHHERYDGAGYPDGLAGESIPILARIIAVTDTYDAMASLRHYGHQRPHRQIVAVLREERGRQHDAYVTDKFLEVVERSPFRAPD